MHPKEKHKICTQCDGRIPVDTQLCPYCAAEQTAPLAPSQNGQSTSQHHRSLQDSLTSPYSPPYSSKVASPGIEKKAAYKEPFQMKTAEKKYQQPLPQKTPSEAMEQTEELGKSSFWPILMLSIGANLLVLGLLQLFFSDNGILRLEWDSNRWFFYCLAAIPLCFFGLKKAKSLS